MSSGPGAHRSITRFLSVAMVAVGIALFSRAIANGGGPLSLGVISGVLFVAAGAGRFYLTIRRG
ncbi:MAG: hypothetical protein WCO96_03670 [Actinomycetes bacterium]